MIKKERLNIEGYLPIVDEKDNMELEFSLIRLKRGEEYTNQFNKERAFLLMTGEIEWGFRKEKKRAMRENFFTESPQAIHVDHSENVCIRCLSETAEIALEMKSHDHKFKPIFYDKSNIRENVFGEDVLGGTSKRLVRTIFDYDSAPFSQMVLGEVVNLPGRWSSFPPHEHEHPEIYHYRFDKNIGFGLGAIEKEAFYIEHENTLCIDGFKTHPQVSAPGFAMYYIWMIPHKVNNPFGIHSRLFRSEYEYLCKYSGPLLDL